jgi:hypothetical protein
VAILARHRTADGRRRVHDTTDRPLPDMRAALDVAAATLAAAGVEVMWRTCGLVESARASAMHLWPSASWPSESCNRV